MLFDPLEMAAAECLDFAAEFKVAMDIGIREDSEAVDHGQRPARPLDDLGRIELQILLVRNGQDQGLGVFQGFVQMGLYADAVMAKRE